MIIYIICFLISIICTYNAEKYLDEKKYNKKKFIFYSTIAILIPSIVAGMRELTIGVDVLVYVEPTFRVAQNINSIVEYFNIFDLEPLYLLLTYVVTKLTNNIHWLLFAIQFIIIYFIYASIYNNRKNSSMWLSMTVYLLIFYNTTYNIARQSIAIALIIYSISYIREKKYIKTLLIFISAIMFHKTAILAIFLYLIIIIQNNKISDNFKKIIFLCMYLGCFLCICFCKDIVYFFTYILEILPDKFYLFFENPKFVLEKFNINYMVLFFRIFWLTLFLYQNKLKKNIYQMELMHFLLVDIILITLSFKITNADRLTYYFWYTSMILGVPSLLNVFKKDKYNKLFAYMLIIMILIIYWYINFIYYNYSATYPYIIGI